VVEPSAAVVAEDVVLEASSVAEEVGLEASVEVVVPFGVVAFAVVVEVASAFAEDSAAFGPCLAAGHASCKSSHLQLDCSSPAG